MKFLVGWQDSILKPVLVNTLTAAVLFVLALFFKPLVHSLFAPPNIAQYPLVCFAEPYSGDTPDERRVDFYIANLTDKSYSRDELIGILRVFNPQPDRPLGPDLRLVMRSDELGRATNAQPDTDFNKSKGQLQVDLLDNSRAVSV